jgi:hypothetical protein
VNAFNTIGDPNDPYRLWEGDQIKTDWSYRNVFRYVAEVIFSGHGINRSAELLWELRSNFDGKWSWNTTASKTVVEPITSGSVSLTVTVRLHLLTDDRDGMIGVSKDTDVYTFRAISSRRLMILFYWVAMIFDWSYAPVFVITSA